MPQKPYVHKEFPKRVWHPETGNWKDAKGPADVPEGWLDRHPADPVHAAGVDPGPPEGVKSVSMPLLTADDRASIIAELRALGVTFNARAPTLSLATVLDEARAKRA